MRTVDRARECFAWVETASFGDWLFIAAVFLRPKPTLANRRFLKRCHRYIVLS